MSVLQNIPGPKISTEGRLTDPFLSWFYSLISYLTVAPLKFDTSSNLTLPGTLTVTKSIGENGVSPPAQVTGWGTPTGAAVINNFPGATATLVQTSTVVAQLISDLKASGRYGA